MSFTYVATWRGFVHVAFIIDVFAGVIVGWRVRLPRAPTSSSTRSSKRCTTAVPPSDSIRYTDRLVEAGIEASVGTVGDSYDNALAESVSGQFKAEVIRRCGPSRNVDEVEFAVLEWVDWWNNKRLLARLGYVPPAEFENSYYQISNTSVEVAGLA